MVVNTCPQCGSFTQCVAASGVVVAKCKLCREYVKNPVCLLTEPGLKREEGPVCEHCEAKNAQVEAHTELMSNFGRT